MRTHGMRSQNGGYGCSCAALCASAVVQLAHMLRVALFMLVLPLLATVGIILTLIVAVHTTLTRCIALSQGRPGCRARTS